jgi:hypothetical protein
MNLVGTPLDIALTPYTATAGFVRKFYMADNQSTVSKVALTPVMGTVYGLSCVAITGAVAVMRLADGLLNVPVGLAVLGSDVEPETALYQPVKGAALVDYPPVYIGGYHCEGFFQ